MLRTVTFNSCVVTLNASGAQLIWYDGAVNEYTHAEYDSMLSARRVGIFDTHAWLQASALAAGYLEDIIGLREIPDDTDQLLIKASNLGNFDASLEDLFGKLTPDIVRDFWRLVHRPNSSDERQLTSEMRGKLNGTDNSN